MRLPSVPTSAMVEHLNTTYFHRVWNAPDDHGRANFDLYKAARRLQIGAVPVNLSVVGLPTTDTVYAVYRVSANVFGRFITFIDDVWVTDKYILDTYDVSITTYATSGRMVPFGSVYLRYDRVRSTILIAVGRTQTNKCIGESYPDLHMTVFKDTTRKTPTINAVYTVDRTTNGPNSALVVRQNVQLSKGRYPAGTMVYVNGWLYKDTIPTLVPEDIVQITSDPDIVGYCDLTVDDNETGYFSTVYGGYRESLHIPKVLNPNNYVITNDTLIVGVFDSESGKGVYAHRLDPHAIESITHNDFSMARSVIQAFQTHLSSQGVFVRLYVRMATNPNPIGREVNLIKDLYSLSDQNIRKQLAGMADQQIEEWRAEHLEASSYLDLLYNFDGFPSNTVLQQYSKAMGYYDVVSTLAQSQVSYTYIGAEVLIRKPIRLLGHPCEVMVYANGLKVPHDAVKITDQCNRTLTVGFHAKNYIAPGSNIVVYITQGGIRLPKAFNPTVTAPSIVMDSEDYDLVKIITYSDDQPVWEGNVRKGYASIPVSPADYRTQLNADGTVTFIASSRHFGSHFYLVPINAMTSVSYPLDATLADKEAIVIPLTMSDDANTVLPLIAPRTVEAYINGHRLIEDIDYTCDPILGPNNDVLQTLLTVSNSAYLNLIGEGNVLEVIVHGDSVVSEDKGYTIGNLMRRDVAPMIWSKVCGRVFVRGVLIDDIEEVGNVLRSLTDVADGSPYLLQWSMPYSVAKLMKAISPQKDDDLRVKVSRLLGLTDPAYPSTVQIWELYALYSPYLARIINDVAHGDLVIKDDPVLTAFLRQFSHYAPLYDRDPTMGINNPQIDRRYVTLAAHYANLSTQDPEQMKLVQKLIALMLTPSDLSIQEVLI